MLSFPIFLHSIYEYDILLLFWRNRLYPNSSIFSNSYIMSTSWNQIPFFHSQIDEYFFYYLLTKDQIVLLQFSLHSLRLEPILNRPSDIIQNILLFGWFQQSKDLLLNQRLYPKLILETLSSNLFPIYIFDILIN